MSNCTNPSVLSNLIVSTIKVLSITHLARVCLCRLLSDTGAQITKCLLSLTTPSNPFLQLKSFAPIYGLLYIDSFPFLSYRTILPCWSSAANSLYLQATPSYSTFTIGDVWFFVNYILFLVPFCHRETTLSVPDSKIASSIDPLLASARLVIAVWLRLPSPLNPQIGLGSSIDHLHYNSLTNIFRHRKRHSQSICHLATLNQSHPFYGTAQYSCTFEY